MLVTLLLVFFVSRIQGHAKLTSPIPWGVYESLTKPCGGPTWSTNMAPWAQWVINTTTSIGWVVADSSDGLGQVGLTFEQVPTNFFTNLSSLVTIMLPNITWQVGDFNLKFLVPQLNCTGPNSTCIVQALQHGESDFVDCTTVSVVASGTNMLLNPLGGQSLCQEAYPQLCVGAQYKFVFVPNDTTLADLSLGVASYLAILNDSTSINFHTPNTPGCYAALLGYLCAHFFQPCNGSAVWAPLGTCSSSCNQAMCLCGLDQSQEEEDLNCATAKLTTTDSNGPCISYSSTYPVTVTYPTCTQSHSSSGFALLPSIFMYCGGILVSLLFVRE